MNTCSERRLKHFSDAPRLEMTSMIDVVFQLLIFFVIAIKPADLLSHLDVLRAADAPSPAIPLLRVEVRADGLSIDGARGDAAFLDSILGALPVEARERTVLVHCRSDSLHAALVQVLDTCAKRKYEKIALSSR